MTEGGARTYEVVVGSFGSGRSRAELEPMIGFVANAVPMRADVGAAPSFAALLRQVHATVFRVLELQDYPFALLAERLHDLEVKSLGVEADLADPAILTSLQGPSMSKYGKNLRLAIAEIEVELERRYYHPRGGVGGI